MRRALFFALASAGLVLAIGLYEYKQIHDKNAMSMGLSIERSREIEMLGSSADHEYQNAPPMIAQTMQPPSSEVIYFVSGRRNDRADFLSLAAAARLGRTGFHRTCGERDTPDRKRTTSTQQR